MTPGTRARLGIAPLLLGAAMIAGAALILWMNRGSTLYFDEVLWFADLGVRDDPFSVLHPHNNHLIGTARSLYLLLANTIGVEYVAIRIVAVGGVLLVAGLLFTYTRRRVGDWAALFPAILLIVYGSAWQHIVSPIGLTITYSIAAGLGALLALERGDRRGDALACALACASVFTYTIGLSYLVGIAVSVLLRADRVRRSWIFLVPLLLYVPWWLWARQFSDGRVEPENLLDTPIFLAKSLASITGSLTGLGAAYSRFGEQASGLGSAPGGPLGFVVAAAVVAAIIWRLTRGSVPRSLWASLAILGTYWLMLVIANNSFFGPQAASVRYVLPGSIALLLVLSNAAKGYEIRRSVVLAIAGVFVFSLVMNVLFLRDAARTVRDLGGATNANLAMMEVAGGVRPGVGAGEGGVPDVPAPLDGQLPRLPFPPEPGDYLAAVDKFGSPVVTIEELERMPAATRALADHSLMVQERIVLSPGAEMPASRRACIHSKPGSPAVPVPPEGAVIGVVGSENIAVPLRRFGDDPGIGVGVAMPGSWATLVVPEDPVDEPWLIAAPANGGLRICPAATR